MGNDQPSAPIAAPSQSLRGALWLPVLLAASFPLLAVGSWAASHPGRTSASAASSAQSAPEPLALPALFSPEVQRWTPEIQRWAIEYRLPAELIATAMQIESCGDPAVSSAAGAQGLFQVMPYHFTSGEQPLDPETNAKRGLAYLARSLQLAGGDRALALAGYNGGHGVIGLPASSWPAETRRYVLWGTGILEDVAAGLSRSPALQAWMDAGGASLCRMAAAHLELN